jgi:hypothetical protein
MEEFPQADYYAAVAQVIPLLFVLVAFEQRVVDFEEWQPEDPKRFLVAAVAVTVGLVASAILGEAAALRVLAERQELQGADFLIVSSIVSATGTLADRAAPHGAVPTAERDTRRRSGKGREEVSANPRGRSDGWRADGESGRRRDRRLLGRVRMGSLATAAS